jgi:hypothetical protein
MKELFSRRLIRKVGNGRNTPFLEDRWLRNQVLKDSLCRLFSVVLNKTANIADLVKKIGLELVWGFEW